MRITGGALAGRRLPGRVPPGARPTAARVREALFSILGDLHGRSVLDAFGGSGILAVEAASRGARVLACDRSPSAVRHLRRVVAELGLGGQVRVRRAVLPRDLPPGAFDLVLADPPWDAPLLPLVAPLLGRAREWLVLEHPARREPPPIGGCPPADLRRYGDTALAFYAPSRPVAGEGAGPRAR